MNWKGLLIQRVHQLVELGLLVGSLVAVNDAEFGGFVEQTGALLEQIGGDGGFTGFDRGAEFLFKGFHGAFTGAVAGVGFPAGAHPFERGFQMCHSCFASVLNFYGIKNTGCFILENSRNPEDFTKKQPGWEPLQSSGI